MPIKNAAHSLVTGKEHVGSCKEPLFLDLGAGQTGVFTSENLKWYTFEYREFKKKSLSHPSRQPQDSSSKGDGIRIGLQEICDRGRLWSKNLLAFSLPAPLFLLDPGRDAWRYSSHSVSTWRKIATCKEGTVNLKQLPGPGGLELLTSRIALFLACCC